MPALAQSIQLRLLALRYLGPAVTPPSRRVWEGDGLEDVEFCLRCRELGYRNVLSSRYPAMHHESATRGPYKHIRRVYNYSIFFSRWSGRFLPDLHDYVRTSSQFLSDTELARTCGSAVELRHSFGNDPRLERFVGGI